MGYVSEEPLVTELLASCLTAIRPNANVSVVVKQVEIALQRYHRPRRSSISVVDQMEEIIEIRRSSSRLLGKLQRATPEASRVIAQALRSTKARTSNRLVDILSTLSGKCLGEYGRLSRSKPMGRPQKNPALKGLVFTLVRVFERATRQPISIANKRTYLASGSTWRKATKKNAGRRFVEIVVFAVLKEEVSDAFLKSMLRAARKAIRAAS